MINEIKKNTEKKMHKSIESLKAELGKLRTGRAHPSILDHVMVDSYGAQLPINQVASVAIENARTLTVTPWDTNMVLPIEKAIIQSNLGLNPSSAGNVIRVPMPPLTEERRKQMTKLVKEEGEKSRVAIRNIRRDANNDCKELLKEKEITEDEEKRALADIQKMTDKFVAEVEEVLSAKEKDLMSL
ncbi:MAG: ribosome recycling factor [Gammaproteobacteria bacterium RIFCSPHIGHO2_12_FULL_41_15]|nr:MAG: ribosome recycling factor [Gammaproteobacteria bacterium RIFCSPHIGHO2_12_FULL_41_15]